MTQTFIVVVPRPETPAAHLIDAGSGIVARGSALPSAGPVLVYFEGNRYEAVNLRQFRDRVACAASRYATDYPTIARAELDASDFVPIGSYTCSDDFRHHALEIHDFTTLNAWVDPR